MYIYIYRYRYGLYTRTEAAGGIMTFILQIYAPPIPSLMSTLACRYKTGRVEGGQEWSMAKSKRRK